MSADTGRPRGVPGFRTTRVGYGASSAELVAPESAAVTEVDRAHRVMLVGAVSSTGALPARCPRPSMGCGLVGSPRLRGDRESHSPGRAHPIGAAVRRTPEAGGTTVAGFVAGVPVADLVAARHFGGGPGDFAVSRGTAVADRYGHHRWRRDRPTVVTAVAELTVTTTCLKEDAG